MPINPNEELTPETSQEAFTARTYDPMQPVPEEAETNMEAYIKYLYDKTQRLPEKPDTREEYFMMIAGQNIEPGSDVEPLTVTENGTYSEAGKAYSPVTVNVPLPTNANERKSVTSYPVTDSVNYPLPKCDVTVTDADKCEVIVTTDNVVTEDSGVYIERQSGGGNRELDAIVGGSIVWNQLVKNGNFANGTAGWNIQNGTLTADNSIATATANTNGSVSVGRNDYGIPNNHVIACIATVKGISGKKFIFSSMTNSQEFNATGNYQTITYVEKASTYSIGYPRVLCKALEINDTFDIKYFNIIDLTATFGTTIADYIYSLEQATAGSGIAWLKSYGYLTEDYYGYTANKIESVSVARHVMKDSNDSVIGSYAINPITLRGIPKINASNQLYYDGDRYEASGRVTRKYGVVDLGSLAWEYRAVNGVQRLCSEPIDNIVTPANDSGVPIMITERYTPSTIATLSNENGRIGIGPYQYSYGRMIVVNDTNYSDATTFKTAMSGVMLIYEKATPTYEDSSPFEANQIVDANGTEEYIDAGVETGSRDVAIPVGHDTKYFNGKAYVKPLTAGTSDTVSMADMGIMPTSPMYISANGSVDVEYWKSNS